MLFISNSKPNPNNNKLNISTLFTKIIEADKRTIKNLWNNSFLLLSASSLAACFNSGEITNANNSVQVASLSAPAGSETFSLSTAEAAPSETANLSVALLDNSAAIGVGGAFHDDTFGTEVVNLTGGSGDDKFTGNSESNKLSGMDGDDTLIGGGGDDILIGGDGTDTLNGGTGTGDTASYVDSNAGVTVSLGGVNAPAPSPSPAILDRFGGFLGHSDDPTATHSSGANGGHADGDKLFSIENLTGSSHADELSGNSGSNKLMGGAGDDKLEGAGGDDTLMGEAGADTLTAGIGDDRLVGGSGVDEFIISGGADVIEDFARGESLDFGGAVGKQSDFTIDATDAGFLRLSYGSGNSVVFENIRATDSDAESVAVRAGVLVATGLNEAPTIGGAATTAIDENMRTTFYTVGGSDTDFEPNLTYSISGGLDADRFVIDSMSGAVRFKDNPDYESPRDSGTDNIYDVDFQVSDGSLTSGLHSLAVTVRDIAVEGPVPPSFSAGIDSSFSITENVTADLFTATAMDDNGGTLSFRVVGDESDNFSVDAMGVVSVSRGFDYETLSDKSLDLTLVVEDNTGLTATHTFMVDVENDASDDPVAPEFAAGLDSAFSVDENATKVLFTSTATDGNAGDSDSFSYNVTGEESGNFSVMNLGGGMAVVSVSGKFDYETLSDKLLDLTLSVSDSGGLTDTHTFMVEVEDIMETAPPVVDGNSAPMITSSLTVSAIENSSAVFYTVIGSDADVGDSLTYRISGGADSGAFTLSGEELSFKSDMEANFESAKLMYFVELVANDGSVDSAVHSLTVSISDDLSDNPQRVLINFHASREAMLDGETVGARGIRYFDLASGTEYTSSAVTEVTGNDYTDSVSGNVYFIDGHFEANTITGSDGDDRIFGYFGDDRLSGGGGVDTLDGGFSDDTLFGNAGDDILRGGSGDDRLDGGADDDTLNGGDGDDDLNGGFGNDTLDGDEGVDILNGRVGDDELTGGEDGDTFIISAGTDTITDFGDGADKLTFASVGVSSLVYSATMDNKLRIDFDTTNDGTADSFVIFSNITASDSTMAEMEFESKILASSTFRSLTFRAVMEAKTHQGELGFDTVSYADDTAGVTITLSDSGASGTATAGGFAANDILLSIENLTGGSGDDELTGDDGNNRLEGGAGTDTLNGGLGNDVLVGGDGTDTLNGGAGDDELNGGDDNDTLNGGADNDSLVGGKGVDILNGDGGDDVLRGGDGADILDGGSHSITGEGDWASYLGSNAVTITLQDGGTANGTDQISGDRADGDTLANIENLEGGSLADKLTGNSGDNWLRGGRGSDTLDGGAGIDTASYYDELRGDRMGVTGVSIKLQDAYVRSGLGAGHAFGTAQINGGNAVGDRLLNIENIDGTIKSDNLTGNSVANEFTGRAGSDALTGGGGDDVLDGGAGNDNLVGDEGNDILRGGSGKDNLTGGAGVDTLDGGSGSDTAIYFGDNSGAFFIVLGADGAETRAYGGNAEGDLLSNIENIRSGNRGDILWGNSFANIINGFGGADVIDGGDGDDTLQGGSGNDTFIISRGDDNIDFSSDNSFSAGSDTISFVNFAHITDEMAADFSFSVNANNKLVVSFDSDGTSGAERSSIEFSNVDVDASGGAEEEFSDSVSSYIEYYTGGGAIVATSVIETHTGTVGDDYAVGVSLLSSALTVTLADDGSATLISGGNFEGDSLVSIRNLVGGAGDDVFTGNAGANRLEGRVGSDRLDGGDGNDTLMGGRGSDRLDGGVGDDTLTGGEGRDTFIVSSGNDTITDLSDGGLISFMDLAHIKDDSNFAYTMTSNDKLQVSFDYSGDGNIDSTLTFSDISADSVETAKSAFMSEVVSRGDFKPQTFMASDADNESFTGGLSDRDVVDYSATSGTLTLSFSTDGTATGTGGAAGDMLVSIEHVIANNDGNIFAVSNGSDISYRLEGGDGADIFQGSDGADTLLGGDGNDTLDGGVGGDRIDGGAGIDTLTHDSELAGITIVLGDGETGTATISGNSLATRGDIITSIENIIGSNSNDDLTGNSGVNRFEGGDGDDILYGGGGNDELLGGSNDDTLNGGAGADILSGGVGNDALTGGEGSDTFIVSAGTDAISNTDVISDFDFSEDVLSFVGITSVLSSADFNSGQFTFSETGHANDGSFRLVFDGDGVGATPADSLIFANIAVGLDSFADIVSRFMSSIRYFDPLVASASMGEIHDGEGTNGFVLEAASADESVDLVVTLIDDRSGTVTIADSPASSFAGDKLVDIQSLTGGAGADTFTGNIHDNVFRGGSGDDELVSLLGDDRLYGGAGDDKLSGGVVELTSGIDSDNDILEGGSGDDLLEGGAGDDFLRGGSDSDDLRGGSGSDTISGGFGNDIFVASLGIDIFEDFMVGANVIDFSFLSSTVTITAGASNGSLSLVYDGDDSVVNLADSITLSDIGLSSRIPTSVPDSEIMQTYSDYVEGRIIRNRVEGSDIDETLMGGTANDLVIGYGGIDMLMGGAGNDFLRGGAGNDKLMGEGDDDILDGGAGTDTLNGGAGNDILTGGIGADTLDGGADIDTAFYAGDTVGVTVTLNADSTMAATIGGMGHHAEGDIITNIENLSGGTGADTLTGNTGDNILDGGVGVDTLDGGAGDDELMGGIGADTFVISAASGTDTITDFVVSEADRLDFSGIAGVATADNLAAGFTADNKFQVSFDSDEDDMTTDDVIIFTNMEAEDQASADAALTAIASAIIFA